MRTIFFLLVILFSCTDDSVNFQESKTSENEINSEELGSLKLNNPAFFLGGNFLHYIQILAKKGEYNKIMEFSSRKLKDKYGKEGLLNYFKAYNFAPQIKIESLKKTDEENYIIYYTTIANATQVSKNIEVFIENDSCKLNSLPF